MKELNFQELAFAELYLSGDTAFNAYRSALEAGYSESVAKTHACQWVSLTTCPPNKRHLRDYIHSEIIKRFGDDAPDSDWLLKRCKLLVDFNIKKFLRQDDEGNMVYDFSTATDDDWYCVESYLTERVFRLASRGEPLPVDKLQIKTGSKTVAMKILGEHHKVQAWRENMNVTGEIVSVQMTKEELIEARREAMNADDC